MGYVLGIDLGDTVTSAAVVRADGPARPEPHVVPLDAGMGEGQPADAVGDGVPSVLHMAADGTVLVGSAAVARGARDPHRLARGFVDRVGDGVPVVLPEGAHPAATLASSVAVWVADSVTARQDEAPERIALTHPPSWGAHRCAVLRSALRYAGFGDVVLLPNVAAVAHEYARQSGAVGSPVGVVRVGARHVDVATLSGAGVGVGVEPASAAVRSPSWIGASVDDHLLRLVLSLVGCDSPAQLGADPETLVRLRAECEYAKRRLTRVTNVTVPVPDPGGTRRVEVTRSQLEALAKPVLWRALSRARDQLDVEDPTVVVIAGGAASTPVVRELATTMFGERAVPVPDPAGTACRGAALAARAEPGTAEEVAVDENPGSAEYEGEERALSAAHPEDPEDREDPVGSSPPRPPVEVPVLRPPQRARRRPFGKRGSTTPGSGRRRGRRRRRHGESARDSREDGT